MYDELIEELRRHHCDAKEDDTQEVCEECAYDVIIADKSVPSGIASVCVCGLMNRAADAIEELSKPRWIPVKERLPDFEGCVLCMRKAFVGDKLRYQDMLYYEDGTFYMEFEDTPIPTEVITHWMPLPEPPGVTDINVGNKTCVDCQRDCQMIGLNMPACTAYEPPKEEQT